MTSTDIAHVDQNAGAVDQYDGDRRRLNALYRECQRLAASKLVPKEMQGDPDTVFALARYGEMYNLAPIHAIHRLYVIEGRIEPTAEVLAGVVMQAGHEIRWDETSSERCTVSIRRKGTDYWQSVTWTIDDAKRAGHLDEWVERWVKNDEGRNRKQKYVLGSKGPAPDWAQKLIDAGQISRNEAWWRYPGDHLAAKAMKRAAKRICGDALLLLDDVGEGVPIEAYLPGQASPGRAADTDPFGSPEPDPDDDPDDGELVESPDGDDGGQGDEHVEDAEVIPPDPAARRDASMKKLMVTVGKAFPESDAARGQKTARQKLIRRAAQYVVLKEHRSAADLTADELDQVESWIYRYLLDPGAVTPMRYEILDGDVVRFTLGDKTVDVSPPERDEPAAA